jgi:hypothetical protein
MDYVSAKAELLNIPPRISFRMLAIEAVIMIVVADILVGFLAV